MLLKGEFNRRPESWSPDGKMLVFQEEHPETGRDLWVLTLGEDQPMPLLDSPYDEGFARVSPDGRWLAYVSNESGRDEVYAQPFPGPARACRYRPMEALRRYGREVVESFFTCRGQDDGRRHRDGPALRPGAPEVLFEGNSSRRSTSSSIGSKSSSGAPLPTEKN